MLEKDKYKIINISLAEKLNEIQTKELDFLLDEIDKKDMFIQFSNGSIILHLRQIDIKQLKNLYNTSNNIILKQITDTIENIKSYGLKGKKRIFVDYNKERKVKNRKQKEENRGKYFYALDHSFNKENNLIPREFENKIICADSNEILKKLPDNCIDLVFTSPPYNFGLDYADHKDQSYWEEYFNKLFKVFKETIRVVKYGGRIIINIQPLFSDYIPSHHIISNFFIENKMIWKGEILWEKNNYNCKYTAWGSWKSPSSPYLKYTWEFIEVFCKGDLKKVGDKDKIDLTADEFKKWVVGKWSIAPERNMQKFGHPAMFPEELAMRIIKLFTYQDDIILDPFNGVGTTTLVARKFGRKYLGMDISEEYCKTAQKRIDEFEE